MKKSFFLICFALMLKGMLFSQGDDSSRTTRILKNTKFTGYWSLSTSYDIESALGSGADGQKLITPEIRKSYFGLETRLSDVFTTHFSQEIYTHSPSSEFSYISLRLKHLYLDVQPFQDGLLEHFRIHAGIIPRPWLEFEHNINEYRFHLNMATELLDLVNAADRGISISGMIGEPLPLEQAGGRNERFAGKYGSYSLGVYSGGGYLSSEKNNNKTLEGRLSLRPLTKTAPGLQLSYSFAYGKGNIPEDDLSCPSGNAENIGEYFMSVYYLSNSSKYINASVQYIDAKGDYLGQFYKNDYKVAGETKAFSMFLETSIPKRPFSFYLRYDYFLRSYGLTTLFNFDGYHYHSPGHPPNEMVTTGISYKFLDNMITLGYQNTPEPALPKRSQSLSLMMLVRF